MQNTSPSDKKRKTAPTTFDPFSDRLSRDIRNSLSKAFVTSLKQKDASHYKQLCQKWLSKEPAPVYEAYIRDRLQHYDHATDIIQKKQVHDARLQAAILWNHRLFFEVHDILEDIWHKSEGVERQALKGWIKAAGVYVHMENKRIDSAKRLAEKAVQRVRKYAHCLRFISNLNQLINALRACESTAPKLKYSLFELERNNNGKL